MEFYRHKFPGRSFTLYLLGDWHIGSKQCDEDFIQQVVDEIKGNPKAYWVGMGDMMENAIVGSKSDVYTQTISPEDQMDRIAEILMPIRDKGLFMIAGNHEQRTVRVTGLIPERHISKSLGWDNEAEDWIVPFKGFSCYASFLLPECHTPYGFNCYFHHNYGGGYTAGGKVNRADALRKIAPTADAIFSGHFHITSRMPVTWFSMGRKEIVRHTGYDYITGSALTWDGSYAEERGKPAATVEHIKVTFEAGKSGNVDGRNQKYEVITPQ